MEVRVDESQTLGYSHHGSVLVCVNSVWVHGKAFKKKAFSDFKVWLPFVKVFFVHVIHTVLKSSKSSLLCCIFAVFSPLHPLQDCLLISMILIRFAR